MRVSELIEGLSAALETYGDLQVGQVDGEVGCYFPVDAVCLIHKTNINDDESALGDKFIGLTWGEPLGSGEYPQRPTNPVVVFSRPNARLTAPDTAQR